MDSFCWKVEVFVLKNYFLLSLMFLLNFSIPFVQKQFHIGFHNGWKCRLGITIDVTYRMNSIQKRGGVELLLVCWLFSNRIQLWLSVNFIQGQYKAFFSICSTKPFTKQTTNQRSIFLLFWTFSPLRDHFSFMQYFIWMNFESIHSVSKTLKKSHFHSISYLKM